MQPGAPVDSGLRRNDGEGCDRRAPPIPTAASSVARFTSRENLTVLRRNDEWLVPPRSIGTITVSDQERDKL